MWLLLGAASRVFLGSSCGDERTVSVWRDALDNANPNHTVETYIALIADTVCPVTRVFNYSWNVCDNSSNVCPLIFDLGLFKNLDPAMDAPAVNLNVTHGLIINNIGFSTHYFTQEECNDPNRSGVRNTINSIPSELGLLTNLRELRIRGQPERYPNDYRASRFPSSSTPPSGEFFDDYGPRNVNCADVNNQSTGVINITAHIPTELGLLTNLEILELHGLGLTGPIPAELAALTKLKHLLLGANGRTDATTMGVIEGLTGDITSDLIGNMGDLTVLGINQNMFGTVNVSEHPSLKLVYAQSMGPIEFVCGANAIDAIHRSDTDHSLSDAVHSLLDNGNTEDSLNGAVDALYNNYTNKTIIVFTDTPCSDVPTTSTTTIITTTTTTTTTTSTTTITTTLATCADYPTTDNVTGIHNISSTAQYHFCTSNVTCPCHLVFRNTASQPVYGSFSELTPLCLQLETLVFGSNVFMSGTLRTLADGGCSRLQRIVIEAAALLNVPLHVSDFHSFPELKILKLSGGIYGSISSFEHFSDLQYADVSHGFLRGTPTSNFWTGVFSKRLFDATDEKTLGTSYPIQNLSTFATHNFLTADASFGAQFPSDLAPVYRYQRISPLGATLSPISTAAHSGGSVAGHDSSSDSSSPETEHLAVGILCAILVVALFGVGLAIRKDIRNKKGYENERAPMRSGRQF
jgi:hypothetical protein